MGHVRNHFGWREQLARLRGSSVRHDLRGFDDALAAVERFESDVRLLPDAALAQRARALRRAASSDEVRCEMFALVRDASRRALGQRPFDVQVVAALALHAAAVVEMQTGEGKTLTAVMPAALNALSGQGVHVLTFNDYLARRDAEWMGPVYRMLGLSVAWVDQTTSPPRRRDAYAADVTYVTAREAGFDHLRDLTALDSGGLVHRPFYFAIVDEADSLMIDEARVPLVIAGSVGQGRASARQLADLVTSLTPGVHFSTDEHGRSVELTEAGFEYVERLLECGSLHEGGREGLLGELNCALHARALLQRDVAYIVREGRIEIVDEFTGRVVQDRKWPDGLQSALEAKEGLPVRHDGQILGSITMQRFLKRYPRLCGMTGTARDAAPELQQVYGLDVVVIPTNRPMRRTDRPDVLFARRDAKELAIVDAIRSAAAARRPVLVGTATVQESERLAARLGAERIGCVVLNAKNDAEEARIVAQAGAPGAVTISTNMAGRGTDIRLGGEDEARRGEVVALGGLLVIGTGRQESRRVDLQLRGRAGRQGDPGESRFFVSLEDDMLVRFGLRGLLPESWVPEGDEPIENAVVRREIARVQRIVEGQHLEIRRTVARYASVVEDQHERLIERRQALLNGSCDGGLWRECARYAALVAAAGEEAVHAAETRVTLLCIDRAWRDHLELCAALRDGIHLVRLGGQDPLQRFATEIIEAFSGMEEAIERAVVAAIDDVRIDGASLDLEPLGLQAPSSTWTYLVNDDPFRNQIGSLLTGAGGVSVAIYSAYVLMPLLLAWGVVDRFVKSRKSGHVIG